MIEFLAFTISTSSGFYFIVIDAKDVVCFIIVIVLFGIVRVATISLRDRCVNSSRVATALPVFQLDCSNRHESF